MKTIVAACGQEVRLSQYQKPMEQVNREIKQQQEAADRYARAWGKREKERAAEDSRQHTE